MQKIDYLENKVNELLYEVNYLKNSINKNEELIQKIFTENFILNSNLELNSNNKETYTSLTDHNEVACVDKWIISNGANYNVAENKVTLPSMGVFKQIIDEERLSSLKNKNVTLTANIKDFTLNGFSLGCRIYLENEEEEQNSIIVENKGVSSITFYISDNTTKLECFLLGSDNLNETEVVLSWFKLEIGTYFTNYIFPNENIAKLTCGASKPILSEVLYDKNSENPLINWGFTSGIQGGTSYKNQDFSKYKALRFYIIFAKNINFIGEMSLINPTPQTERDINYVNFRTGDSNGSQNIYYAIFSVASDNKFGNVGMGFFASSTKNIRNLNADYYIYKIEGLY